MAVELPRLNTRPKSYVLVPANALFITINGSLTNVFVEATVLTVLLPKTVRLPVIKKSLVTVILLLNSVPTIDPGTILALA